jgi:hypothetical protein
VGIFPSQSSKACSAQRAIIFNNARPAAFSAFSTAFILAKANVSKRALAGQAAGRKAVIYGHVIGSHGSVTARLSLELSTLSFFDFCYSN